jgi:hypothetical protein
MLQHMKAVTVHLDEQIYARYQKAAKLQRQTTSELIRQAMAEFPLVVEPLRVSILKFAPPKSVGKVSRPWKGRQDLLDDFFYPS